MRHPGAADLPERCPNPQYTHWQGFDIAAYADAATVFLDTILALVFVPATCVYVALSRLLVLLLGIPAGGAAPASAAPPHAQAPFHSPGRGAPGGAEAAEMTAESLCRDA